jgi:hypothetical protein
MKRLPTIVLVLLAMIVIACGPDQRIIDSAKERDAANASESANSNVAPSVSSFEKDVAAMRNADFKFIVVFRRKDGKPLDSADKAMVVKSASQANRRSLSDGDKAVIIGSNFPFAVADFQALSERFAMENYSKPDSGEMTVANANSNR